MAVIDPLVHGCIAHNFWNATDCTMLKSSAYYLLPAVYVGSRLTTLSSGSELSSYACCQQILQLSSKSVDNFSMEKLLKRQTDKPDAERKKINQNPLSIAINVSEAAS